MTKSGEKITILHVLSNFKGEYPLFNQVVLGLNEGKWGQGKWGQVYY